MCHVSVLCSSIVLVDRPGHFLNRAAGVGLSKDVCCVMRVLCCNCVFVRSPGQLCNRTVGIGLSKTTPLQHSNPMHTTHPWSTQFQQSCYKNVLASEQAQHDYTAHTGHSTHPWTTQHQQSYKKVSCRARQDNITTQHTQGI